MKFVFKKSLLTAESEGGKNIKNRSTFDEVMGN